MFWVFPCVRTSRGTSIVLSANSSKNHHVAKYIKTETRNVELTVGGAADDGVVSTSGVVHSFVTSVVTVLCAVTLERLGDTTHTTALTGKPTSWTCLQSTGKMNCTDCYNRAMCFNMQSTKLFNPSYRAKVAKRKI